MLIVNKKRSKYSGGSLGFLYTYHSSFSECSYLIIVVLFLYIIEEQERKTHQMSIVFLLGSWLRIGTNWVTRWCLSCELPIFSGNPS